MKHLNLYQTVLSLFLAVAVGACSVDMSTGVAINTESPTSTASTPEAKETGDVARPANWAEASHSDAADPNYAVVFPEASINQITITIAPEDWEAMQANMTELFGEAGTQADGGRFGPGGGQPPAGGEGGFIPGGGQPPADGNFAPGGGGGDMTPENPMWVEATLEFNGQTWSYVGVRYKGNSSLTSSWRSGTLSLPLKLDFDEFEDEHPEIDNQRFYGFKQLSLSNNFGDASYLRETVTYDLLEEAGLPAAETAFYEVILDYGEGPVSLGLYTAVEVIDDTVVDRIFGTEEGNIYEADGSGVSLAEGTAEQISASFQKENNETEADWSDIEALYAVLHSDLRTTHPEAWRAELEAVFETDSFLEWLALSAVIQHWDTYGGMSHNFYLYNDPESGQLVWISWDHNFVLGASAGGGSWLGSNGPQGGGGPGRRSTSLDKADVGAEWPLIRYLLDDPVYYAQYMSYLEETVNEVFTVSAMAAKYQALAEVVAPYVAEQGETAVFEAALQTLMETTTARVQAVNEFLATP